MIVKYIGMLSCIPIIFYDNYDKNHRKDIDNHDNHNDDHVLLCNDNTDNTYLSPPPPRFLRSNGELSRVLMS